MPVMTLTKTDTSKKGSRRAYFNNNHGWQDAFYVGRDCERLPPIGTTIDADTTSNRYDGAKADTWFINGWRAASQASYAETMKPAPAAKAGYPIAMQAQQSAPQPAAAQQMQQTIAKPSGWALEPDSLSRLLSNVLGAAIAADKIKEPQDITRWVSYAYRALEAVREGKPLDFDDPVPRFADPAEEHGYPEPGDDIDGAGDPIPF